MKIRRWLLEKAAAKAGRRGQGLTEYIIIVAFISLVCIGVIAAYGKQIKEYFYKSGTALAEQDGNVEIENKMTDVDMGD